MTESKVTMPNGRHWTDDDWFHWVDFHDDWIVGCQHPTYELDETVQPLTNSSYRCTECGTYWGQP